MLPSAAEDLAAPQRSTTIFVEPHSDVTPFGLRLLRSRRLPLLPNLYHRRGEGRGHGSCGDRCSSLPTHGVHGAAYPVPVEDIQSCHVYFVDVRHILLVQVFYQQHVLLFIANELLRHILRRHGVADSARFEGAAGRCIQNADTALPAPKTAALIHVQLAAGARASETPILQLLLPDGRTLEQILVLQVRDGELVALFQRNSRSQHECIVFPIRPATRRVTRV
mmetsp:Transcript_32829/g.94458  ORF Transcript_32829/g.94458 Transcript_32829/m.94458 type:complete len:223 (-) Transcript_32829:801-1469(-)